MTQISLPLADSKRLPVSVHPIGDLAKEFEVRECGRQANFRPSRGKTVRTPLPCSRKGRTLPAPARTADGTVPRNCFGRILKGPDEDKKTYPFIK
jgi:hypothetical protein